MTSGSRDSERQERVGWLVTLWLAVRVGVLWGLLLSIPTVWFVLLVLVLS